ncbi:YceI family protein [Pelagibaculum spongiae]|uniref:Polyisoprenoid-binding protein n=1 Tax=Pelagibaculum spongiae TaxID=2080658 RepID=A0A2V1H6B0_9GAMM|nr:YceI family protein [Pelagibaculum spongiae]PVZ71962.1 polyisoprenoid-binding protein [Pelagibaculum spongiae]
MKSWFKAGALIVSCGLFAAGAQAAPADYQFDQAHSKVLFKVNHHGLSNFRGQFADFDGQVTLDLDKIENSKLDIIIDPASVDTDVAALDKHLKNADFFDVTKYPQARFVSKNFRAITKARYAVEGELTMHGVTKPVTLFATLNFDGQHPLGKYVPSYKGNWAGVSANATILRSDFGMNTYVPAVGDEIQLEFELELKQKK